MTFGRKRGMRRWVSGSLWLFMTPAREPHRTARLPTFDTQPAATRRTAGRRVKPTKTTATNCRPQSVHEAAVGLFHRGRAAGGFVLPL
jgi:hypothetical protein